MTVIHPTKMKYTIIFVTVLLMSSCANDNAYEDVVKEKVIDTTEVNDHSCDNGCIHC